MTEQSCKTCRWFKKFREEHEWGQCSYPVPFWYYTSKFATVNVERPDLNENEGKDCAAWEDKGVRTPPNPNV